MLQSSDYFHPCNTSHKLWLLAKTFKTPLNTNAFQYLSYLIYKKMTPTYSLVYTHTFTFTQTWTYRGTCEHAYIHPQEITSPYNPECLVRPGGASKVVSSTSALNFCTVVNLNTHYSPCLCHFWLEVRFLESHSSTVLQLMLHSVSMCWYISQRIACYSKVYKAGFPAYNTYRLAPEMYSSQ